MIRVQIISADNLPIPTAKERKTKIFCLSSSSCKYFYDSFKNNENTNNPKWNKSFDVDLFRCSVLTFKLYSSRLLSKDIFLGELNIDFSSFLTQSPGNEILKTPYGNIRCEFPLTSCTSPNAILSLSFLFIPESYRPMQFKDFSNPNIHLWTTFTPSLQTTDNNIEIELLQLNITGDKKNKKGLFYNFNNYSSWEPVGYSSNSQTFFGPTGFTPIRSFLLDRISNTYNFFIIKSGNYSGVITLNFVAEKRRKTETFENQFYMTTKKDKNSLGTVATIDLKVEPNKIYCAPACLFYEKKLIKATFDMKKFQQLSENDTQSKSDFIGQLCSEIPFHSSIIDAAQNQIEELKDASITKTFVLPRNEKVPLNNILSEFNLKQKAKIRIYLYGSTTHSTGQTCFKHFWKPYFTVFDLNTGQTCSEISKKLHKKPIYHFKQLFEKNQLQIDWHNHTELDLDEIGIDKVVVFSIGCLSTLDSADPPGMVFMTYVDGETETVLFRNPVYVDTSQTYWTTFMRFEFIEDSWNIVQMRYPFDKKKKLSIAIRALYKNNWILPEVLDNDLDGDSKSYSSEDFLLDEI